MGYPAVHITNRAGVYPSERMLSYLVREIRIGCTRTGGVQLIKSNEDMAAWTALPGVVIA
jgi:hypothetical protein